ncbi:MAG TPA: MOFRL family protein, partial [Pirellulaceae bacterium]|nr:MOFRL family protein [Pirellulaceae bacterium]
ATLIISDVLGDPLDVIASGPTVPDSATARDALEVLARFRAAEAGVRPAVFAAIDARLEEARAAADSAARSASASAGAPTSAETLDPLDWRNSHGCRITNRVIGNNAVAVEAAAMEARRRGYITETNAAVQLEGDAEELGRGLAAAAIEMQRGIGPEALITGGEPVVRLAPADRRGKGGRNQQLVLAALDEFNVRRQSLAGAIVLSGGTDGEDGPTDAAGAWIDARSADAARWKNLAPPDYLARNDAYTFFAELDTLIRTGPTHTNVCDVRVVLVAPRDSQSFTS